MDTSSSTDRGAGEQRRLAQRCQEAAARWPALGTPDVRAAGAACLIRRVARARIVRKRLIDDRASIDDVAREKNLTASYVNGSVRLSSPLLTSSLDCSAGDICQSALNVQCRITP